MNYETGFARDPASVDSSFDDAAVARRRKWLIIAAIAGVILLLVAAYAIFARGSAPSASAKPAGGGKQMPTISVIVPGREPVARIISATGNIAARREMPIGVAGEGGMVTRVLVEPGSWVKAGQVLATIDRRVQSQQIASLSAQIGVSEADARLAQSELDRASQLIARGFISKADIDRKTATRDAARARVQVARAQLGQQQASTARLDIRAPEAGLVLERKVEPGQVVSAGSGVLFRLAKGGELELLARMGESELATMRPGMRATVRPVGSGRAFTGEIWQVAPIIDQQSRQGIARIALSYDQALRPGGFATAQITSGSADVPLLPESAVLTDTKGTYVLVVGRDNKIERRDVQAGDITDRGIPVIAGLSGQEAVVLSAAGFLNPGEKIIPKRVVRS